MFEGLIPKTAKSGMAAQVKGPRADDNAVLRKEMGARFVEAREINGWGQSESATKLGYGNSTQLSLIERGDRLPPLGIVKRASTVYGVSIDYLFGVSDEPDRDPKYAEKRAVLRQVHELLESNAEVILDTVMDSIASGSPKVTTTRGVVIAFKKLSDAVRKFHELNLKKFDDMRGGNTVLSAMAQGDSLICATEQLLERHDHFVIKAADAARLQRERESRARAQRRAQEKARELNGLSTAPDQFHLSLADHTESGVRVQ